MKKHNKIKLLAFMLYSLAITICLFTYDWKLAVIIIIFLWATNLENSSELHKSQKL